MYTKRKIAHINKWSRGRGEVERGTGFSFRGTGDGFFVPQSLWNRCPTCSSGKAYRRHVALNNLLRSEEYGIPRAYVLCEGNVSEENREGKPVRYLPLYMLPLVAKELSKGSLDGVVAQPPTW